jgi:pilus assembly protein CpaE
MADSNLETLLAEAQRAYLQRDKHAGAQRIDEILQQDFNYPGAWQLLYRLYGAGQSLEEFRRSFAKKYYPDRVNQLVAIPSASAPESDLAPSPKPASFLGRLFSRLSPGAKAGREAAPPSSTKEQAGNSGPIPAPDSTPASAAPPVAEERTSAASLLSRRPHRKSAEQPKTPPGSSPPILSSQAAPRSAPEAVEGKKIHVIVVDDIAQTRDNLIRSLSFQENIEVIGTASNGQQAIQLVKEVRPDVVLMDVNMPDMDGITATQNIRNQVPSTQVIIITVQDDVDYIRRAMNAGARDFLTKPPMIDEMIAAIERAAEFARQEKAKLPSIPPPTQPSPAKPSRGKIITVYSPRGGAGCTLLAANLAATLHSEETPVIVVDGNLQFGDIPIFFNVHSKLSIIELTSRAEELDPDLVGTVVIQHASGIQLLAPPRPEEAESVEAEQFSRLLTYLSELYSYVIVDTPSYLDDVTRAGFKVSNLLVLLTTQDIPSIARARKFLDMASSLQIDPQHILTLMNQYNKRINVTPEKVAQSFNLEIAGVIPLDKDIVISSINRGAPFMFDQDARSRPISQAILEAAEMIKARIAKLEEQAVEASA